MALEFMTGATVFALINLVLFCVTAYFSYRFANKLIAYLTTEGSDKKLNARAEILVLVSTLVLFVFFGSVTQPKLSLDPVQNRALIEYQENNKEVVIETPPPRTEELQGFESLK